MSDIKLTKVGRAVRRHAWEQKSPSIWFFRPSLRRGEIIRHAGSEERPRKKSFYIRHYHGKLSYQQEGAPARRAARPGFPPRIITIKTIRFHGLLSLSAGLCLLCLRECCASYAIIGNSAFTSGSAIPTSFTHILFYLFKQNQLNYYYLNTKMSKPMWMSSITNVVNNNNVRKYGVYLHTFIHIHSLELRPRAN